MGGYAGAGPEQAPFAQQGDHFRGKRGKRGQPAQKTCNNQQPPFRCQHGKLRQGGHGQAHQVAAQKIGRERAQGNERKQGIEPQPQSPARQGPGRRAQAYDQN